MWYEHNDDPTDERRAEAARHVGAELEKVLPAGWSISEFNNGKTRGWWLEMPGDSFVKEGYDVQLSSGLDMLIFAFGNDDKVPDLRDHFHQAMVIPTAMLRFYSVGQCMDYVLKHCNCNESGHS